uniref:Uncharacterized protein n=1 Tax=Anguilla anguilla TaxID=7936 RepID=A0A0E9SV04_ANGAN
MPNELISVRIHYYHYLQSNHMHVSLTRRCMRNKGANSQVK